MAPKEIRPIRVEGNVAYVPLTQGLEAEIDAADVEIVCGIKWFAAKSRKTFYAIANHSGRGNGTFKMHRLLIDCPAGMHVDHIDGNGLNNRRENLRIATIAQNQCNQGLSARNTSGFKGVWWSKKYGRWYAQISVGGKNRGLGGYETAEEAHAAYCEASQRLHGEFGRTA